MVVSLKRVLRVPRLTRQFLEQYEELQNSEEFDTWNKQKDVKKVMSKYKDEEAFDEASLDVAM